MKLVVSAGDPSGDRLGAACLEALRRRGAEVEAVGLGGPALRAAGMETVADMESVAVMGFGAITHLPAIRRARAEVRRALEARPGAIFLPIDSPGLNLGLARAARAMGRRVVYYVCPQIWAWGYGRVRRLREDVDLTLLLFRFEEQILASEGARFRWVGHPAGALRFDEDRRRAAREKLGIASGETLLALLPGSRRAEVRHHLAPMLDAAARLRDRTGAGLRVALSDAGSVEDAAARTPARELLRVVDPLLQRGESEALLRAADLAIVASGTATLETASLGVPFVIVYRTSALNYAIARRLVKLPRIGLANIVMDADVAPERIQGEATGSAIADAAEPLLVDPAARDRQRAGFAGLPERLGGPGAAERAADALFELASGRLDAAPAGFAAR
ncbi:MAG TPA: lipid-A-disaccharide synthase [Candidatus Eisenbacteria bacterium]|nr:lipid-A-disaccharide synthase [Candidatus Eisenbacteria bacterium]